MNNICANFSPMAQKRRKKKKKKKIEIGFLFSASLGDVEILSTPQCINQHMNSICQEDVPLVVKFLESQHKTRHRCSERISIFPVLVALMEQVAHFYAIYVDQLKIQGEGPPVTILPIIPCY